MEIAGQEGYGAGTRNCSNVTVIAASFCSSRTAPHNYKPQGNALLWVVPFAHALTPAHAVRPRPLAVWSDLFYTWTFSTRPQEIWITCNQVVAIVWPAFNKFPGYGHPMHDLEQISAREYPFGHMGRASFWDSSWQWKAPVHVHNHHFSPCMCTHPNSRTGAKR